MCCAVLCCLTPRPACSVSVPDIPGPAINYGTWQSAIYGFAYAKELGPIRRALYPDRLPSPTHRLKSRY